MGDVQTTCSKVQSLAVADPLFPSGHFDHRLFTCKQSTETLLKWSRHRDATVDHPAYISNFKELYL